ncbi:hypothetical protein ECC43_02350 [Helicobacter pylori]|nr:hypothetical protein ECC43_02350 [Helicobacter pylori]
MKNQQKERSNPPKKRGFKRGGSKEKRFFIKIPQKNKEFKNKDLKQRVLKKKPPKTKGLKHKGFKKKVQKFKKREFKKGV